jgi:hypothetical protein
VTDRIALALGIAIIGLITLDLAANEGKASLFLARKLFSFIGFLAFWT